VACAIGLEQLANTPGSSNAALALLLLSEGGLIVDVGHEKNQPEGWLKVAAATVETTALKSYP
jgi:hypothetical protein